MEIFLVLIVVVMIFFMWRNNKKRQAETRSLRDQTQVGADVMTNFGLFGTILEINEDDNSVLIESTPGTVVRVHRQTISRVITEDEAPAEDDEAIVDESDPAENPILNGEPQFGEIRNDQDPGKSDN